MWRKLLETLRRLLTGPLAWQPADSTREIPASAVSGSRDTAGPKRKLVVVVDGIADGDSDSGRLVRQMGICFGLEVAVVLLKGARGEADYRAIAPTHIVEGDVGALRPVASALAAQGYCWAICPEELAGACRPVLQDTGFRFKEFPKLSSRSELAQAAFGILRDFEPSLKSVSVVVPNFNYAGYIAGRLNSIFAQSYPIFDILVLDDASTDGSLSALGRIEAECGRSFAVIRNAANSGSVSRQWTKGVGLAQGELLWIAEADDLAAPDFVERLAVEFNDPSLVMAFADSQQIDEQGVLLAPSYDFYYRRHVPGLVKGVKMPGLEFLRRALAVRNAVFNVSSVLFRRASLGRALDAAAAEFDLLRVAGDWRVYVELCCQQGSLAYVAEPLNVHRRHHGSVTLSMDHWRHIAEILAMHRKIREIVGDDECAAAQAAYIAELVEQLSLVTIEGRSAEATAALSWLNGLAGDPPAMLRALSSLPPAEIEEIVSDIPIQFSAVQAVLRRACGLAAG